MDVKLTPVATPKLQGHFLDDLGDDNACKGLRAHTITEKILEQMQTIDSFLRDPKSNEIFKDPYITSEGITYDKSTLDKEEKIALKAPHYLLRDFLTLYEQLKQLLIIPGQPLQKQNVAKNDRVFVHRKEILEITANLDKILRDRITLETLEDPYVTNEGRTYNKKTFDLFGTDKMKIDPLTERKIIAVAPNHVMKNIVPCLTILKNILGTAQE